MDPGYADNRFRFEKIVKDDMKKKPSESSEDE